MKEKDRLIYFLQTFGIMLVVLGHSFYQTRETSKTLDWIYSFHMPLFFFISGYLLRYTTALKQTSISGMRLWGGRGYLTRKAKRLLLPYVAISSMVFLPKAALTALAARPVDGSAQSYISMLIYPYTNVIGSFWFMPTIFLMFAAVAYGARIARLTGKNISWISVMAVLLAVNIACGLNYETVLNISGVVYYMLYMAGGYLFCMRNASRLMSRHPVAVFLLTLALSVTMVLYVPYFRGYDVITAVNGIAMSISLGNIYTGRDWHFLDHLYGATYTIYLLSWFPQVASQQVLLSLVSLPWPVTTSLAFLSGIYLPLAAYRWIINNKGSRTGRLAALVTGLS